MNEEIIGRRVKAFRENKNIKQVQIAEALGFSDRQTVSMIERGKRKLKAVELVNLTKILDVSFDDLTNQFKLAPNDNFSWRHTGLPLDRLDFFEKRAGEWIGAYRELNRLNNIRLRMILPQLGLTYTSSLEDAVRAGEAIAEELDLGIIPSKNLFSATRDNLGVLVLMVEAEEGLSGAAYKAKDLNVILINRHETPARRNTNLAHELFHILTWSEMKPQRSDIDVLPDMSSSTQITGRNKKIEKLADNFASGLLMPPKALDKLGEPTGDPALWLVRAGQKLGVSAASLKWKMVNSERYESFRSIDSNHLKELSRRNLGDYPIPSEFSKKFVETLVNGIVGAHLSVNRAATLTNRSRSELAELIDCYEIERPIELT